MISRFLFLLLFYLMLLYAVVKSLSAKLRFDPLEPLPVLLNCF